MANHRWNLISPCHDSNNRFYVFEYVSEFDVNATKTLKIININNNLTVHNLKTVFERFGKIIKIHFEIICSSGISKTNALIRYVDISSVVKAINTLNGNFFAGTSMNLVFGISSPSICVWIGGLSNSVDEFYLLQYFKNTTCCLIDQTRKHALVYFTEIISAQMAITQVHDSNLNYHKIQVDFASIDDQQEFYDHYRLVYNTESINHSTTIQIHNNNMNNFNKPNFPKPEPEWLLSKKQQCNSLRVSEANDDCSISFMNVKTKEYNIINSKNNIIQITEQIIPVIENCNMYKAVNYFNSSQMMTPTDSADDACHSSQFLIVDEQDTNINSYLNKFTKHNENNNNYNLNELTAHKNVNQIMKQDIFDTESSDMIDTANYLNSSQVMTSADNSSQFLVYDETDHNINNNLNEFTVNNENNNNHNLNELTLYKNVNQNMKQEIFDTKSNDVIDTVNYLNSSQVMTPDDSSGQFLVYDETDPNINNNLNKFTKNNENDNNHNLNELKVHKYVNQIMKQDIFDTENSDMIDTVNYLNFSHVMTPEDSSGQFLVYDETDLNIHNNLNEFTENNENDNNNNNLNEITVHKNVNQIMKQDIFDTESKDMINTVKYLNSLQVMATADNSSQIVEDDKKLQNNTSNLNTLTENNDIDIIMEDKLFDIENKSMINLVESINLPQISETVVDSNLSYHLAVREHDVKPITNNEIYNDTNMINEIKSSISYNENHNNENNIHLVPKIVNILYPTVLPEQVVYKEMNCQVNKLSDINMEANNKSSIKYRKCKSQKSNNVDHVKINDVDNQSKNTKRKKGYKIDTGNKIIKANNIKITQKYNKVPSKKKERKKYTKKGTQNNINKLKNIQQSKKQKCQEKNQNKFKHLDSTNILLKKRTRNSDINLKILKVDSVDSQSRINKINSSFISKIFNSKKKLNNKNQNCTYSSDEDTNLYDNKKIDNKFKQHNLDSTNILSKKKKRYGVKNLKKLKVDNVDSQYRISKINSSSILKIFNSKKKLNNKNENCTNSSDEDINLDDNEYCKAINRWRTDFSLYDFELNIPVKSVYDKISVAHAGCLPKKY